MQKSRISDKRLANLTNRFHMAARTLSWRKYSRLNLIRHLNEVYTVDLRRFYTVFKALDKVRKINFNDSLCVISSPNPMFDHLLE